MAEGVQTVKPRTLIDMPAEARTGEWIRIRATIGHPMETGYRRGPDGALLGRNVIREFVCSLGEQLVLRAELFPAISANPYLSFQYRAERSGELIFRWRGDEGFEHVERVALTVR
jgi:sulfur-oxidizing protein SoxZ